MRMLLFIISCWTDDTDSCGKAAFFLEDWNQVCPTTNQRAKALELFCVVGGAGIKTLVVEPHSKL